MASARVKMLSAAVGFVGLASIASGGTWTWSGGFAFGPNDMSQASNWSPNSVPINSDANLTLIFPGSVSSTTPNQNIASPLSLQSLVVSGPSYNFNAGTGYSFTNLGAAPTITTTPSVTFGTLLSFATATTWTMTGPVFMNGQFGGGGNINVNAASTSQFTIGGGLASVNSGTFIMNAGTLNLQRAGGVALAGGLNASNMTVNLNQANQFSSSSDITLDGTNMIVSASQVMRDLRVNNGATVSNPGAPTITINGTISSTAGSNSIGNNPSMVLNFNGGIRTINITAAPGDLTNINATIVNGRYQKTGSGVVQIFNAANSYTGTNLINGGSVRGTADSIGTVLNNANVRLYGGTVAAGQITGTGSVTIDTGVIYAGLPGYTGVTEITGSGALIAGPASVAGIVSGSATGALVDLSSATDQLLGATLTGQLNVQKGSAGVMSIGGVNSYTGTTLIFDGGINVLSSTAFGSGSLLIGNTTNPTSVEATGSQIITNPILPPGILEFTGGGNLRFANTAPKFTNFPITHNSTGTTTFDGNFQSATVTVNSGTLVVGNLAAVNAYSSTGQITVNGGTLVVRGLNFTTLSDVTLAGGTLFAPNGYAIPLGAALQGAGGVAGRVASANGSSIIASGNLSIGDAAHPAGVNFDGELYTAANNVTLLDSNSAVLGSYTQLGNGVNNGSISAANGVVLNFGRNIVGRGQVVSGNSIATASIINGDVNGDSLTNFIEFTGYVKGVGNFDNVAFSGTFAPGLSPTLLTVGNVVLTPSNVLDMELGGLLRGGQYDAFNITGIMMLNGQLKLSYINSFVPSAGDQFDLFDGTTTGTFSSFNYPPLPAGLMWDNSLLYTQGIVQVTVIPEPVGIMALAALGLLARRRRH